MRQEDCKFKTSPGYIARTCPKNKQKFKTRKKTKRGKKISRESLHPIFSKIWKSLHPIFSKF
jgi:hypothetical protein